MEVTNPLHTYLTVLLHRVRSVQSALDRKLDAPTGNMASGKVWAGPTAREWAGRLADQCKAYNSALSSLDEELSAKLAGTPRTCSEDEARRWRMALGR